MYEKDKPIQFDDNNNATEKASFSFWDDVLKQSKGLVPKEVWKKRLKNGDIIIFSPTDIDMLCGARRAAYRHRCVLCYIDHEKSKTDKNLTCIFDIEKQHGKEEMEKMLADGRIVLKFESYI